MKQTKIFLVILIALVIFTGCNKKESQYEVIVNNLEAINVVNKEDYPFTLNINIEKIIDEEIMYSLIIDDVKEDMNDIRAIIIHNKETNDIFPSIGVVDEPYILEIDGDKKGLSLIGYIDFIDNIESFKGTFKVYVSYYNNENKLKEYYYEKQY